MNHVLLIDFGSTFTKVTAVDVTNGSILGTAKSHTTVSSDINAGLNKAVKKLFLKTGTLNFSSKLACSSAAGGLKMIAIGLVPDLTSEAARRAALNAGAKLLKTFSYELNDDESIEITNLNPDIILLTGGTDGGNKEVVLHNANVLKKMDLDVPIIVSCNKSVALKVVSILEETKSTVIKCNNVMPEFNILNIDPTQKAIRDTFLERIIYAKGLSKVTSLIDNILMPTPSAVLKSAELLSLGSGNEDGIGDLLMVDIGGATTDVYSIAHGRPKESNVNLKGLPEPHCKRTVEGDLGLRYTSQYLLKESGIDNIVSMTGLSEHVINSILERFHISPDTISNEDKDVLALDNALSIMATKIATNRHCGTLESHFTPFGEQFLQVGKDLRDVKTVIGTGGPFVNSENAEPIFKGTLFDTQNPILKPFKPQFLLDEKYILSSMGLLGEKHPEMAIKIMKKELSIIN